MIGVGGVLERIANLNPGPLDLAILEVAHDLGVVTADLGIQRFRRQLPQFFGTRAVFRVHHHHVRRQAVRKGSDLTRGAAGRWLTGQRERAVAGLRLFAQQQVVGVVCSLTQEPRTCWLKPMVQKETTLRSVFDVEICQLLQLLLEIVQRFVGIAFGKLGDEVEGVGFDTAF